MGDVSVIARRLSDKYVQYGWSGNGGYPGTVGAYLWNYYNTPDMVEYLFSLGQLRLLCEPGSEKSDYIYRTTPTGEPHWVGTSELDIYSKIAFVDHMYLYDSDETWYYVNSLIKYTKIPLDIALKHVSRNGILDREFDLYMERLTFKSVRQWYHNNKQFQEYAVQIGYDDKYILELEEELAKAEDSLYSYDNCDLRESLERLYRFFDPWTIAKVDASREHVEHIILIPRSDQRIETINWNI